MNTTVLGRPGDHTAGIMYDSWTHPKSPISGISGLTNYPYGDSLRNPISASSIILSVSHWSLSHFGTIATGWNLMVLIGYMTSALAMFGFVYWLTKNAWASFFSGYAIAFTPYHVFASRGQIAGLYGFIFILVIWQFMRLWKKPHYSSAILLGSLLGIGFYMDGYFILIGFILLSSLWLASIGFGYFRRIAYKDLKPQLTALLQSSIVALAFLMPLLWVNVVYSSRINSILGNMRGSIEINATTYSAKLPMYLNPKGILFIGLSVLTLACIGVFFAYKNRSDKNQAIRSERSLRDFYIWALVIVTIFAIWFSLQPVFHIGSVAFYNPSKLIISITAAWRVFGRLYVLVAIGFVALAGLGLHALFQKFPHKKYYILGASLLLLILEMSVYPLTYNRGSFSYTDTPSLYKEIKDNANIRAIAEYPLNNPEYNADYFTFQSTSNKPMLNSFVSDNTSKPLHQSIIGINDPQTIPVLRALGIDMANLRSVEQGRVTLDINKSAINNAALQKIQINSFEDKKIGSYAIKPGYVAEYALVMPGEKYGQILLTESGSAEYIFNNDFDLSLFALPTANPKRKSTMISFTIVSDSVRTATLVQNGKTIWSGKLSPTKQTIKSTANTTEPMSLFIEHGKGLINVTVSEPQSRIEF